MPALPDRSPSRRTEDLQGDRNLFDTVNRSLTHTHDVTSEVLQTLEGDQSRALPNLVRNHFKQFVALSLGTSDLSVNLVKTLGRFAQIDDFGRRVKFLKSMTDVVQKKGTELSW